MTSETRHVLVVDAAGQARDRYPRLPFVVPQGATSFEVRLEVPDGLVIDLGCEGPDGWRGWSGGARRGYAITADDATPGYLPGVRAGEWFVVLGLHGVADSAREVVVTVTVPAQSVADHGPVAEPVERTRRGSDRGLPAPAGLRWYAGDLHAHSLHSDGALSLWQLANEGVSSGLDFLAVTDHNTVSHHPHLAGVGQRHGIVLLPGQEVTTHRGHANAFGRIGFVNFRRPGGEWSDEAKRRGGLLSVNHPVSGDCSWWFDLAQPDAVEIYHGSWYEEPASRAALAWLTRVPRTAVLIGGADFHNHETPLRPGLPTTWIAAEDCTEDALLAGLIAGRTTITAGAFMDDGGAARPDLFGSPALVREGHKLTAIDAAGLVLVRADGQRIVMDDVVTSIDAPREQGPCWIEKPDRSVVALSA